MPCLLVVEFTNSDLGAEILLAMLKNVIEEVRTRYSWPVAVFLAGKEDVPNKLSR